MQSTLTLVLLLMTGAYCAHFLECVFGSAFIPEEPCLHAARLLHHTNQIVVPVDEGILNRQRLLQTNVQM